MGSSNRRIGERKPPPHLVQVEFGAPRLVGWLKKKPIPSIGRLLDVSVTGASIEAYTSERIRVGSRVRFVLDGMEGVVLVRRIRPTALEGVSNYGVAFYDVPHDLTTRVHELVGRDRPDTQLQQIWDGVS